MGNGLETSGGDVPADAPVVVVAGPTASGKSAAATAVALAFGGTVINADSMQVYRDLRILTARPGDDEVARVPHRLYGFRDAAEPCSAAEWAGLARAAIAEARAAGRLPVVVGGTGLYIEALMHGLSPVPDVPPETRAAALERLRGEGAAGLHRSLAASDPEAAARIRPSDSQRLVRAWEVLAATGRSIVSWQAMPREAPVDRFLPLVLAPPREALYAACDGRLGAMLAAGALDEVAALAARGLDPALPAMKALGIPEFRRHVAGELPLDEALARARQATRRYAKRQLTWFRHRLAGATRYDEQFSESLKTEILSFIRRFLLTHQG